MWRRTNSCCASWGWWLRGKAVRPQRRMRQHWTRELNQLLTKLTHLGGLWYLDATTATDSIPLQQTVNAEDENARNPQVGARGCEGGPLPRAPHPRSPMHHEPSAPSNRLAPPWPGPYSNWSYIPRTEWSPKRALGLRSPRKQRESRGDSENKPSAL